MPNRHHPACALAALAAFATLGSAATASAATLQMPFKCNTTVYGQARSNHSPPNSIDFNGLGGGDTDLGMPVVAAGGGTVSISTYYTSNGYGNAIEIRHPNGQRSFYAHLRDRGVRVGQKVQAGQVIGHVGKSSAKYTFTAHLHYEQRDAGGHTIQARFGGRPAPVYAHLGASVRMTSRNCGKAAPTPPPAPQPQPPAPSKKGIPLPNISTRFAATVQTDNGLLVSARRAPRTGARKVLGIRSGQQVRIVCQKRGERVSGKFGTSRIWDLIDLGDGRGAYVTDTYVYTGSDGRVAPTCP